MGRRTLSHLSFPSNNGANFTQGNPQEDTTVRIGIVAPIFHREPPKGDPTVHTGTVASILHREPPKGGSTLHTGTVAPISHREPPRGTLQYTEGQKADTEIA